MFIAIIAITFFVACGIVACDDSAWAPFTKRQFRKEN